MQSNHVSICSCNICEKKRNRQKRKHSLINTRSRLPIESILSNTNPELKDGITYEIENQIPQNDLIKNFTTGSTQLVDLDETANNQDTNKDTNRDTEAEHRFSNSQNIFSISGTSMNKSNSTKSSSHLNSPGSLNSPNIPIISSQNVINIPNIPIINNQHIINSQNTIKSPNPLNVNRDPNRLKKVEFAVDGEKNQQKSSTEKKSDTGVKGTKGDTGPRGSKGDTGPKGTCKNIIGATGPKGQQGQTGPTGPAGLKGLQGEEGPTGATGIMGPIGPTGPAGASAKSSLMLDTKSELNKVLRQIIKIKNETGDFGNPITFILKSGTKVSGHPLTIEDKNILNLVAVKNTITKINIHKIIALQLTGDNSFVDLRGNLKLNMFSTESYHTEQEKVLKNTLERCQKELNQMEFNFGSYKIDKKFIFKSFLGISFLISIPQAYNSAQLMVINNEIEYANCTSSLIKKMNDGSADTITTHNIQDPESD